MTNLAKPAKMSNTAFFCHVAAFLARFLFIFLFSSIFLDSPRFSSILLDFPRFSSILLDSPRFSSILLDFPRFSSILLDSPRFSSILLDSPRLFSIAVRWQEQHKFCNMRHFFAIFHFWGPFFPTTGHFALFWAKSYCKIVFFGKKSATLHHFWPFASKTCNIGRFCTNGPFSPFFLPKVAKLPLFVGESRPVFLQSFHKDVYEKASKNRTKWVFRPKMASQTLNTKKLFQTTGRPQQLRDCCKSSLCKSCADCWRWI